jgi:micrococcal nuclease
MIKPIKFFLFILAVGVALGLFPITIGGLIGWLIFKKVANNYFKYSLLFVIGVLTLFFGSVWVAALISPSKQQNTQTKTTPLATQSVTATPNQTPIPTKSIQKEFYKVIKVIDGDTINVSINGKSETIRLIGIDSPETVDPRKPVQCFGIEASNKAKEVLTGKNVSLEADSTQGERDKYNRLLRYIFLEDGTNFNKLMISEGYAHEYTYQSNPYKYQEDFINAEKSAEENKRGLWADGACITPTPTKLSTPTIVPKTTTSIPLVQPTQSVTTTGGGSYTCNCSKTCTQIATCEEAYYQLNQCGCTARDGDLDGVPCESLCR